MRIQARHAAATGDFAPPRTVDEVTRQLSYRADRTLEGVLDQQDVLRNSKLAQGLLTLAGRTSLDVGALRGVVQRFAGSDGIVDDAEYLRLAAAVRRTTAHMPDNHDFPPMPQPDLAAAAHGMLELADANFDGVVDQRDVAVAGSDMAASVLQVAKATSLTEAQLATAIDRFEGYPGEPLPSRIEGFVMASYGLLHQKGSTSLSVADLGRGAVWAFDGDQNLLLQRVDGKMAQRTLADAGAQAMRENDVANHYRRYDTVGADGRPGHDGRLDTNEIAAMMAGGHGAATTP